MWHRISAGTDTIGRLLHDALLRNRRDTSAGIAALRQMRFDSGLKLDERPVKVRFLDDALYLNDEALRLYRSVGGVEVVDEVSASLPNDPLLGSLINDVWQEERP